jgi:aryl-alcohol dehydrogenase-like predicted oxidoreductase
MALSTLSRLQLTPDMNICRILNGMWQVSGGHGRIDPTAAVKDMFHYLDAGFTTWDLADHYGPAEDLMGEFRRQLLAVRGQAAVDSLQIFTKWVPQPTKMTKKLVEENINKSLRRMGVESIDLLQFHWWDYRDSNYLDALRYLSELQKEGKIKHLGLTNFDTERLKIIHEAGIRIVSNQVQYSIIDRRPEVRMIPFCQQHNIKLLTYGTLCGGLLSEKYLGALEPRNQDLNTISLKKYKNMVDKWGGWQLFQELLTVLKQIGNKHNVSIANVAVRYILDKPAVGGVIIGARLGLSEHLQDTARVFEFSLDADDNEKIDAISRKSQDLYQTIGDCGDEYR